MEMDDLEIQNIWNKSNYNEEHARFSLNELRAFRAKFSGSTTSSTRWLITFDSIYKITLIIAYLTLIFLGGFTLVKAALSSLVVLLLSITTHYNKTLNAQLNAIDESKNVVSVLKSKYTFLQRFYREFLFTSSITNPIMVLAGFQFYQFFKYGEDKLIVLLHDPVTYVFLILAFLIPFIVQKINYAQELRDLKTIISIDNDDEKEEIKLIQLKRKRKTRQIVFILLLLIGLAALLILLNPV